jgi:Leucine-rich repeat (LRR) protein
MWLSLRLTIFLKFTIALLHCDYKSNPYYGYSCELTFNDSKVIEGGEEIIYGNHLEYRDDYDVLHISASYENLENFPPVCEKFQSLKRISFASNGMENLQNSLEICRELSVLLLNDNIIAVIPHRMFQNNSLLVELNLSENKIHRLHRETFDGLEKLKNLLLDRNEIENIFPEIFTSLISLETLRLDSNRIKRIPPKTFEKTINLKLLGLQKNLLRRINANAFGSLQVTTLDLSANEIEEIHDKLFEQMSALKLLYLDRNKCINRMFYNIANISTQVLPFMRECFAMWNARLCEFSHNENYMCTINGMLLTNINENFEEIEFLHDEGKLIKT